MLQENGSIFLAFVTDVTLALLPKASILHLTNRTSFEKSRNSNFCWDVSSIEAARTVVFKLSID